MSLKSLRSPKNAWLLFLLALFLFAVDSEAHWRHRRGKRVPRYRRPINTMACEKFSWKPSAKSVPGGRQANARVPFMTDQVHSYLEKLNAKGCGLVIQSTFRDCVTNRNVGGMQMSWHLCGSAADTSGCSKPIASSVCRQSGMRYREEGGARFPHCETIATCAQIKHD